MIKHLLTFLSIIIVSSTFAQSTVCAPDFFGLEDTIKCNDSTMIIFNNPGGGEDFSCSDPISGNNVPCNAAWALNPGVDFSQPYTQNSPDGNGYLWMGDQISSTDGNPRTVTSPNFNTSCGGQICFDFVYASQGNAAPLEGPDQYDEGIALQYLLPGGTWTDMKYWAPNGDTLPANPGVTTPGVGANGPFTTWQDDECVNIPPVAQVPVVQFRFFQENDTDLGFDHWGIDDVVISINADQMDGFLTGAFDINGAPITPTPPYVPSTFTVQPDSLVVKPTESTMYTFVVSNASFGGSFVGFDTVWVYLEETEAGAVNQLACNTVGTELFVNGVMPNSPVTWSPNMFIDSINSHTPFVIPTNDMYYTVTSDCGVDSVLVDVVPIFNPILSASSDSICVGDITSLTAGSDQPGNAYTYQWSPATVAFDTAMTTDAFPTINTTYYVEMVSDSGCIRTDSIQIYVGAVPRTINYNGLMSVCPGDSSQITVLPVQPTFFDDFELGANPSIWDSTYNATANTDCGVPFTGSTNTLHFNGAGARGIQTFPLDASLGGTISFYLIYGSIFGGGPCDDVAFNAEMQLQYSIDGGVTWAVIRNYENVEHDNWELQTDTVPLAAQTPNTLFRLHQDNNGGNNQDNWAIDDFLMELNCTGTNCVQYSYNWSPASTVSDATIADPFFFPATSTWYTVAISPEGFNCTSAADSIFVTVDEYPVNITPGDTFLCESAPILLEVNNSDLNAFCTGGGTTSGTEFTLDMFDTFGDGWDGASIDVLADGTNIGNYTIATGSVNVETFTVPSGATIDFVFNDGAFDNEHEFTLFDENGNVLFFEASGGANLTDGFIFYSTITGCTDTMFWSSNNINTLSSVTSLSPVATTNVTTTYIANVINTNGCLFQDSVTIEIYESNIGLTDNLSICFDQDSVQLEATGADTYIWTSNLGTNTTLSDTSISNPMSGTNTTTWYNVEFNTQGCIEEDSVRVTILNLDEPEINNGIDPVIFCDGETAQLQTTQFNGFTYTWSGPENGTGSSLEVSTPGVYSVEYFDGNCTNQSTVTVSNRPIPELDFSSIEKNLCCDGDEIVVDYASVITNYNLSEISEIKVNEEILTGSTYTYFSENDNFTQLDAISVTSIFGCEGEGDLTIYTNCLNPSLSSSIPDTVWEDNPTVFDLNINSETEMEADEVTYIWSTSEPGNNVITDPTVQDAVFNGITEGLDYEASVTVTSTFDGKQCSEEVDVTKQYDVVVLADPIYPDAFSPNADGLNDVYRPILNPLAKLTEMRIYNRWGDLVYDMSTNDNKNGWDGKYLDKDQAPGIYTYFIKSVNPDENEFLQEGQVNLIR